MYNGVGLQTARGSGTSGYVQRNLAYAQQKRAQKFDYGEQLKKMRENPLPPPKPANRAILEHEEKRRLANRKFVAEKGLKTGKELASEALVKKVDTHLAKVEKERAMEKLADAFKINKDQFEHGAAFDLELQEMKRLQRIAEVQEKKRERKREEKRKLKELEAEEKEAKKLTEEKEEGEEREDRRKKHRKDKKDKRDKHKKKHKKRRRSHSSGSDSSH